MSDKKKGVSEDTPFKVVAAKIRYPRETIYPPELWRSFYLLKTN
jgi:hypothetical protein